MARIGDYINPAFGRQNYAPLMGIQQRNSERVGQSIQEGVGAVTDAVKARGDYKKKLKVGQDQIKAAATLYGDESGMLAQLGESLSDEEAPLSQRAAAAENISNMINMQIDKQKQDQNYGLAQRGMSVAEANSASQNAYRDTLGQGAEVRNDIFVDEYAANAAATEADAVLKWNILQKVDPDTASELFDSGLDGKAFAIAVDKAMARLPQDEVLEMPVTIDGQAGEVLARYDPVTGVATVVPVQWDTATAEQIAEAQQGLGVQPGQPGVMPQLGQQATSPPPAPDSALPDFGNIRPGAGTGKAVDQELLAAQKRKAIADAAAAENRINAGIIKTETAKKVKARNLKRINKYIDANGNMTEALKDATGVGEKMGSLVGKYTGGIVGNKAATIANQQELAREIEGSLLEASKYLKPVSNDEMKMLMNNRPQVTDPPKVWELFLKEARRILEEGTVAGPAEASDPISDVNNRFRNRR